MPLLRRLAATSLVITALLALSLAAVATEAPATTVATETSVATATTVATGTSVATETSVATATTVAGGGGAGVEPAVTVPPEAADAGPDDWTYRYLIPTLIALAVIVVIATTIQYFLRVVRKRYKVVE